MRLLLLLCMIVMACGPSYAGPAWQTFVFDGNNFASGDGSRAIMTRDGYLPVPASAAPREDQLPDGTGAVAVLCYQQRSGGKLRSHAAIVPLAGGAVTIRGKSLTVAGRCDESGYLILALPPGTYQLQFARFTKTVTVEKGKTSLVAFRGSKRMVD